jgi:hypothetical protein
VCGYARVGCCLPARWRVYVDVAMVSMWSLCGHLRSTITRTPNSNCNNWSGQRPDVNLSSNLPSCYLILSSRDPVYTKPSIQGKAGEVPGIQVGRGACLQDAGSVVSMDYRCDSESSWALSIPMSFLQCRALSPCGQLKTHEGG